MSNSDSSKDSDAQIYWEFLKRKEKWTDQDLFKILDQPRSVIKALRKSIINWTINNYSTFEWNPNINNNKQKSKIYYENVDNSFAYSLLFIQSTNFSDLKMPTLNKPDYSIVELLKSREFNSKLEGEFFKYIYNPYIFNRDRKITESDKLYILKRYSNSIFSRKDSDYKQAICKQIFRNMNTNVLNFNNLDCNVMRDDEKAKACKGRLEKFISITVYSQNEPIRYQRDYIPRILISLPKSEIFMHQTTFFRKYMLLLNEKDTTALIQNNNLNEFKKFIKTIRKDKIDSLKIHDYSVISMSLPNALLNNDFDYGASIILYIFFTEVLKNKNFYQNYQDLMTEFKNLTIIEKGLVNPSQHLTDLIKQYCNRYFKSNKKLRDSYTRPTLDHIFNTMIEKLTHILCREDDDDMQDITTCSVLNLKDLLCGNPSPLKCSEIFEETYFLN